MNDSGGSLRVQTAMYHRSDLNTSALLSHCVRARFFARPTASFSIKFQHRGADSRRRGRELYATLGSLEVREKKTRGRACTGYSKLSSGSARRVRRAIYKETRGFCAAVEKRAPCRLIGSLARRPSPVARLARGGRAGWCVFSVTSQ